MALTLVTSDLIHGLDYSKLTGTIPTWNQNTTGNAAGLSATLAVGSGGTGVTSITALKNVLDDETWTFANNATFSSNHIQGSDSLRLLAPNSILYLDAATDIVLRTNSTTERLRISSGGNTTFNNYITIKGANSGGTNSFMEWRNATSLFAYTGSAAAILSGGAAADYVAGNTTTAANVILSTNNTERLRILSGGNVGIGTTVPQYPLQVKSGTNINFSISTGVADNTAVRLNAVNDAVTANIPMEFYATKFNFNNGNVGIGTPSPGKKLDVQIGSGSSNGVGFINGGGKGLEIYTDSNASNADIYINQTSSDLASLFYQLNGSTKLTISSGGNVGILTTPSTVNNVGLSVAGTSSASGVAAIELKGSSNAAPWRMISSWDGTNPFWGLFYPNDGAYKLQISSTGAIGQAVTPISDPYVAGAEQWMTYQIGKGGIFAAYKNNNESMFGFNTYTKATDGAHKAIISNIGGSATRYYADRITFNTLTTSGTAQTQTEVMRISPANGIASTTDSFHSGHDGSTGSSGAGTTTVGCTLGSGGWLTAHRTNATCLYIGTTTDREVMAIFKGTSQAGKIRITGASTVAFESGSDYRLKEDLKDFNGLDIISKLKVYNFNWIGEDRRDHGLIAHEVQEVLPDLVSGEKDGVLESGKIDKQTLDYGRFTPMLIKAMQEQQAQIELLKQEVELLKQ